MFRYTVAGSKTSQGFGRFPGVSLAEARDRAAEARKLLDAGINPVQQKRRGLQTAREDREQSVTAAVEAWLASDVKNLTSPKYAAQKRARLTEVLTYATKGGHPLGPMAAAAVETRQIVAAFEGLVTRGADETARRVLRDLEKAFDWARGKGWRSAANPCTGVLSTLDKPKKVGHRAPTLSELGAVVQGLRALETEAAGLDCGIKLAEFLLLTAARTKEVRLATWDEVFDLDGAEPFIEVPAERMKKRIAWTLPLSRQAADLLRELRANAQEYERVEPQIFYRYSGAGAGVVCSENTVNNVLVRAGLHDKLVGHGFRKLFSTAAHSLWPYASINRERCIEHSLSHVNSDTVEGTYNKSAYLPERRLLTQWWADHLDTVATSDGP